MLELPIYLDNAATTPVAPEVIEAMLPFYTQAYGNPATLYSVGMMAREAVMMARETIAQFIHADPDEIVFTSGGTEADNAAIWGVGMASRAEKRHVITSSIEHHAVLEPMESLVRLQGFDLDILPIDSTGRVSPEQVARAIRPDTALVSIMHANNEIGTVQPIAEIGAICREKGVLFHTDAVQTYGKLPIDVRSMNIDMLSVSAHKLHGPKGVGFLYVKRGTPLLRFMQGGEQEKGRRAGTLNVPGIVGLGKATEIACENIGMERFRLSHLRDRFWKQIQESIPGVHLNGDLKHRLPNNLNICIEGVAGESVLLALDAAGICAAAGSACSTGSVEPSHVLRALGISRDLARGALRLTLGRDTTAETLDFVVATLTSIVSELRQLNTNPASQSR